MKTKSEIPFFSIVIPVYQDTKRLKLCLDTFSNIDHSGFEFEVIVVNNDPGNPKLGIDPDEYSYLMKEVHEPIPGSYAARNMGIKAANGKIIGFTDSDMIPDSQWLQVAFKKFKSDAKRKIGILTGPVPLFYKEPNKLTSAEIYEKYTGFDFEGYARDGATGAGNWFSYKSVLQEFGCFREDLKSNGDTDLSLKITKKYNIEYLQELVNRHPARHTVKELVFRYRRILGGTYSRRFSTSGLGFFVHTSSFIFRRYRFAFKKIFTVSPKESLAILKVCHAINIGALKEYFNLVSGGETKR